MYAFTSIWFVSLTRATFRRAELGFLGVMVNTFVHTPLFRGQGIATALFFRLLKVKLRAGDFVFLAVFLRGLLINWLIVGII